MDRLDELAVFVAIVEAGSLAEAGRRIRRSPPAITRSLAALEQRVGARLLQRSTRRIAPTEAGLALAERARGLLAAFDEAMSSGNAETTRVSGVLRISAPLVFGRLHVLPLVSAFLDAHPGVQVEMILSDHYLDLIEDGLDLALRIGALPDSGMIVRRVGQVRRVLVASPAYLADRGTPQGLGDLKGHDIIFTTGQRGPVEWRFRDQGRARAVRLAPRLAINQVDGALLAARDGRGIASALSYQVYNDLTAGTLIRVLARFESPPLPVQIVIPSVRQLPARVRHFFDHAVCALSELTVLRGV